MVVVDVVVVVVVVTTGADTTNVSDAAGEEPRLEVRGLLVFTFAPAVEATTDTLMVQVSPAASAPPPNVIVAPKLMFPLEQVCTSFGVEATDKPLGKMVEKAMPVASTEFAVLSMTKPNTVTSPTSTGFVPKLRAKVGGVGGFGRLANPNR